MLIERLRFITFITDNTSQISDATCGIFGTY